MRNAYLGRITRATGEDRHDNATNGRASGWKGASGEARLEARVEGPHIRFFDFGPLAVLLRGYAADSTGFVAPATFAQNVRQKYARTGTLPVASYEGAFTVVLLDAAAGRALIYRSPLHAAFTYYGRCPGGMAFGANLADLIDAFDLEVRPNLERLPAFFLYRYVPGRETLCLGVERLLAGELVTLDAEGATRTRARPLDEFVEDRTIAEDAEERFDALLERILADCRAAAAPQGAANMLSGGVDSSLIQAIWCRMASAAGEPAPPSCCIDLDHSRTRGDTEYAVSAAARLGSRLTLVPARGPYELDLIRSITATGEVPNHVQAVHMRGLARALAAAGTPLGVTGWGADGLFGNESVTEIQAARLLRAAVPFGPLRRLGRALVAALGWSELADHFLRADILRDEAHLAHPMNQASIYTTWPAVEACFTHDELREAVAYRRALLGICGAPGGLIERTLACDTLSDGMEQAAIFAQQFLLEGGDMLAPFFDSRMVRFAMNLDPRLRLPLRRPKQFLKDALARLGAPKLAYRAKKSFGQPIFEWLAPGGSLRPFVDRIGEYDFIDRPALADARERPNWFLYTLLCYDLWHKRFVEGLTPEQVEAPAAAGLHSESTPALAPA
jgi:asparagine synthase (glutamine-hydrolysing)